MFNIISCEAIPNKNNCAYTSRIPSDGNYMAFKSTINVTLITRYNSRQNVHKIKEFPKIFIGLKPESNLDLYAKVEKGDGMNLVYLSDKFI